MLRMVASSLDCLTDHVLPRIRRTRVVRKRRVFPKSPCLSISTGVQNTVSSFSPQNDLTAIFPDFPRGIGFIGQGSNPTGSSHMIDLEAIRTGLNNGEFFLEYLPTVSLRTTAVSGRKP